ncbi:MAG TPA: UDP-N-acetylmuramate--L-alanine ligase [Candidatus Limnocylindria bacterium]|nr:UDP-N-acetylmuramate--L-alanine ligase [Candidatus Limnocylindria bacterium]
MVQAGERIHVIGIAGSGAAGATLLLHRAGVRVDGCDADASSPYTPPLVEAGIPIVEGHDPSHLAGVDRVAISPGVRAVPGHAELEAAEAAGLPVTTWQALLGELMAAAGRIGVGVTGTHGKSTTTALLGHLLASAGLDPTVEVGAFIETWGASVRSGGGAPFVVEADEFGDNFLNYRPAAAIVTNVEMDHPDYFADASAVMASFERFARGMEPHPAVGGRLLVIAADDPGAAELTVRLGDWDGRIVRYGSGGDVEATGIEMDREGTSFFLLDRRWRMPLAGRHNVANATAALLVARELGAHLDALAEGVRTFAGAGRRMQLIADTPRVTIYDDYGHHPTEVRAALAAARQKVGPDRRLWAVFEPHMYSRTALLMDAFSTAFADANEVVIADIFASRDTPEAKAATSAEDLADAIERASGIPAMATGDVDATTDYVADHLADGDAVLVMGAGKSYRIARGLASRLADGAAS